MYCKFCGNRIADNTTKCASCGADIDLRDGGQSFFDDNELDAWRPDDVRSINIPKTEMREPLPEQKENAGNALKYQQSRPSVGTRSYRSHRKKKKTLLDYLNLSSANRLIIFCIASALAIVLLVVAIISVFNSGKESTNDDTPQATSYAENTDAPAMTNAPVLQTEPAILENENNSINTEKEEIKGIRIIINDSEIKYPVSAYMLDNKIYVSIDSVLKEEGYKAGSPNGNAPNRIVYENEQNGMVIEIEKGTKSIFIREEDEKPEDVKWQQLDGDNFNEGSHTYVPARSFFALIGYNNVEYDEANNTLTVRK